MSFNVVLCQGHQHHTDRRHDSHCLALSCLTAEQPAVNTLARLPHIHLWKNDHIGKHTINCCQQNNAFPAAHNIDLGGSS